MQHVVVDTRLDFWLAESETRRVEKPIEEAALGPDKPFSAFSRYIREMDWPHR